MTRHLFVVDPLERIHIDQDSSFALMEECQGRGHEVYTCDTDKLGARGSDAWADARPTTVRRVIGDHVTLGEPGRRPLGDFDVVWMRKDPPFDMQYVAATWILDLAPPGTRVVNSPDGLRGWNEKACVLRFPELTPACLMTRSAAEILAFQRDVGGAVVLKPLSFSGGAGIVALHPGDLNTNSLLEISTRHGQEYVLAQQYLPAVTAGDKRVILIGGKARGAVLRIPPDNDLRGNIHVGARVELSELTAAEQAVCDALEQPLRDAGHLFVGIDLIGERLTEINVTSPTGIQEIKRLGGPNLAAELVDAALAS